MKPVDATQRPNIYSFHDHRLFLPVWFEYLKNNQKGFSLRLLARETQMATGYIPSILSGKLKLSEKSLKKFIRHIRLTATEQSYLLLIRTLTETHDPQERVETLKKMQNFSGYRELNPKEIEAYRYWTHWFYPVIREMTALPDFKLEPNYIQSKLREKVPLGKIKEAIQFLVENHFIEKTKDGRVKPPKRQIECLDGIHRISLGQFHREMLGNAIASIENTASQERSILGEVLAIDEKDLAPLQEILEETRKKIAALAHSKQGAHQVYHVALAAFPVTNNPLRTEDQE